MNSSKNRVSDFTPGQFVEHDGLLAVVIGTPDYGGAPDDHLTLWFGEPGSIRISEGGSGGGCPEIWNVPAEYCKPVDTVRVQH